MNSVVSKDGTRIAFDKTGHGPAVIIVDGAMGSRAAGYSSKLAALLASTFTVYTYDRRGRGDSGDTQPFAGAREVEDIEALIGDAGGNSALVGFSSGGALALEAAIALGDKVEKLAIYEAPYDDSAAGIEAWHGYTKALDEDLAAGKRAEAVTLFMKFVGVSDAMLEGVRTSPMWPMMETVAPTLAYDAAALGADRTVPVERAAGVTVPALLMDGEASAQVMPFMAASADVLARAIPHAERKTLAGQAHDVSAEAIAPVLVKFLAG